MPKKPANLKVAQGQRTLSELLEIAENLFAKKGYAETTTAEIIALAGVTKGALYHHFASKRELFEAVYIAAEREVAKRIDAASTSEQDPWKRLIAGCNAYLEACSDIGLQRILRVDGPAALGLETWRRIDHKFGLERLLPFLQLLSDNHVIAVSSVEAFGRQLTGAMNEATFWIAQHPNREDALKQSQETLGNLLAGIRVKPG